MLIIAGFATFATVTVAAGVLTCLATDALNARAMAKAELKTLRAACATSVEA